MTKTSFIQIRVSEEEKALMQSKADLGGLSLSEWLRRLAVGFSSGTAQITNVRVEKTPVPSSKPVKRPFSLCPSCARIGKASCVVCRRKS